MATSDRSNRSDRSSRRRHLDSGESALRRLRLAGLHIRLAREALEESGAASPADVHLGAALDVLDLAIQDVRRVLESERSGDPETMAGPAVPAPGGSGGADPSRR